MLESSNCVRRRTEVNIRGWVAVAVFALGSVGCSAVGESTTAVSAFVPAIVVTQSMAAIGRGITQEENDANKAQRAKEPFEASAVDPKGPSPGEVRALLADVDFSACRRVSVRRNYGGRGTMTIEPSGRVANVTITEPTRVPDAVTECIAKRLEAVPFTPWQGQATTIGIDWYVP